MFVPRKFPIRFPVQINALKLKPPNLNSGQPSSAIPTPTPPSYNPKTKSVILAVSAVTMSTYLRANARVVGAARVSLSFSPFQFPQLPPYTSIN